MHRSLLPFVVGSAFTLLAGCGGDDSPTATQAPTTTTPLTGACTLITAADVSALFASGIGPGTATSTDDRCSLDVVTANNAVRGTILLAGSGIPFETAKQNAIGLGMTVTEIDGIGDGAFFTNDGEQYWVAVGVGDNTYDAAVTFRGGASPPPADQLQATLERLVAAYVATL
ncbi:MAG: hypothetical protein IPL07_09910 [Acidimicrobiaceae bacterium]|nr:hypothetical protein [Acidimicrobiaceae bacterium]